MYIFYFVHATTTLLTNYTTLHEHFTTIRADASELISFIVSGLFRVCYVPYNIATQTK